MNIISTEYVVKYSRDHIGWPQVPAASLRAHTSGLRNCEQICGRDSQHRPTQSVRAGVRAVHV